MLGERPMVQPRFARWRNIIDLDSEGVSEWINMPAGVSEKKGVRPVFGREGPRGKKNRTRK